MTAVPVPHEIAGRRRTTDRSRGENRLAWKLVAPAVVVMLVVTAYPMFEALYLSLFRYRLTTPGDKGFVGLSNYGVVLTDSLWWKDVGNTLFIMVVTVAVELVIGFAFAMVMHRVIFGRGVIRTSILIPYGIITVVSAFSWQFAFSLNNGFVNEWFQWLPFVNHDTNWFGSHWPAMYAICVSEIWKTTPFMSLLLLAGLSQISEDMLEAAKVDGATERQIFFRVVLPVMAPINVVIIVITAIESLRAFDIAYIINRGKNGLELLSTLITNNSISEASLVGFGSAIAVVLLVISLVPIIIFLSRVNQEATS